MKKNFIFSVALALVGGYVFAQNTASTVTFVNTGKMYIGGTSSAYGLYVPDAVRTFDALSPVSGNGVKSQILLNGYWAVGGNFYKDCDGNVVDGNAFVVDANGRTTSTGTIDFVSNRGAGRTITYVNGGNFDRSTEYVAFPNIVLTTKDTVLIPFKMGIDATTINSVTTGKMLLESYFVPTIPSVAPEKVYDASLRVLGSSVTQGSVIVEKWVKTYRTGSQLFGFASPFLNTQKSGYFAGNWVRMPEQDANMHSEYYLGNKPQSMGNDTIHTDQYVKNPNINLDAGRAYLIKPRPKGFTYQDLIDDPYNVGLMISGVGSPIASAYDQDKFVFNGKVYQLNPYEEVLYIENNLPVYKMNGTPNKTLNWLIGNSYTCAISLDKLGNYLGGHIVDFSPIIYVFPAGSTTYQPYDFRQDITLYKMEEIPAMSIFMVRPSKDQSYPVAASTAEFKIDKSMLVHSTVDHGQYTYQPAPDRRNAPKSLTNQVIFRLTSEENESNFDLSAIGLRANGSLAYNPNNDIPKVYMGESSGFQLYTLSAPDANDVITKLSINCVSPDVEKVAMNVKPIMSEEPSTMVLSVEGIGTLLSEDFWIEDLKTNARHFFHNDEPYVFTTDRDDAHERFIVHFKAPGIIEKTPAVLCPKLNMYAIGKEIFIENLLSNDIGANAAIYDIAGKLLDTFKVTDAPKMSYVTHGLVDGVYIMRLHRNNIAETLKLIIR